MNSIIKLENISKKYGDKHVLSNINIQIEPGDNISIIGASGAGKSTLLNILGGLDAKYEGTYYFEGQIINNKNIDFFRNKNIGFIFQSFNLLSNLTAVDNVMLPYSYYPGSVDDIEERVNTYFKLFGLNNQMNQLVNTLSGGEKQRVALIRSIVLDPEVILADEPTGNLDNENSLTVQNFLKYQNSLGKTIITVTHDMNFAKTAKRCLRIDNGCIYE